MTLLAIVHPSCMRLALHLGGSVCSATAAECPTYERRSKSVGCKGSGVARCNWKQFYQWWSPVSIDPHGVVNHQTALKLPDHFPLW